MSEPAASGSIRWIDDSTLVVDGVELVARTAPRFESQPDRFCLVKRPELVRRYLDLFEHARPRAIVELGILQGGSAALTALVARPSLYVAIDVKQDRVPALDALLERRGLSDQVHLCYGVDQADPDAMGDALAAGGVDGPVLDLVIDDASHLLEHTRTSFELLFPLVRPGGRYVIEDWSWAHIGYGSHLPDEQPLTQMVFELTMALPSSPGLISGIEIDRDWAIITRGDRPIDLSVPFSLSSLYSERGRRLLAAPSPPHPPDATGG